MSGNEIRQTILDSGLKLWQVAKELGVTDGNFSRRLRYDFNEPDAEQIFEIIAKLKSE